MAMKKGMSSVCQKIRILPRRVDSFALLASVVFVASVALGMAPAAMALPFSPYCEGEMRPLPKPKRVALGKAEPVLHELHGDFKVDGVLIVSAEERALVEKFEKATSGPEWFAPGLESEADRAVSARAAFEKFFRGGAFGGLNGRTVAILTTIQLDGTGEIVPFRPNGQADGKGEPHAVATKRITVVAGYVTDVEQPMVLQPTQVADWIITVDQGSERIRVPLSTVRRLRVRNFPTLEPGRGVEADRPYSVVPDDMGLRTAVNQADLKKITDEVLETFLNNIAVFNQIGQRLVWVPRLRDAEVVKGETIAALETFEQAGQWVGINAFVGEVLGVHPYSSGTVGFGTPVHDGGQGLSILVRDPSDGSVRFIPKSALRRVHVLTERPQSPTPAAPPADQPAKS